MDKAVMKMCVWDLGEAQVLICHGRYSGVRLVGPVLRVH